MVANTGTYVDSPFHRYADGKDLSQLPLESLANLACVVAQVETSTTRAIDHCRSSRRCARQSGTGPHRLGPPLAHDKYFEGFPHLTLRLANGCETRRCMVGIDSHNIDNTDTGERPCTRRCSAPTFRSASISAPRRCSGARRALLRGAGQGEGLGTFPVRHSPRSTASMRIAMTLD